MNSAFYSHEIPFSTPPILARSCRPWAGVGGGPIIFDPITRGWLGSSLAGCWLLLRAPPHPCSVHTAPPFHALLNCPFHGVHPTCLEDAPSDPNYPRPLKPRTAAHPCLPGLQSEDTPQLRSATAPALYGNAACQPPRRSWWRSPTAGAYDGSVATFRYSFRSTSWS